MTIANIRRVCPACSSQTLSIWYEGSRNDVGDVEPRAACNSKTCDFAF